MNQLQTTIARTAGALFLAFFSLASFAQSNYAVNFDGVDDYIEIPNTISGDFTLEYWMKTTSTNGGGSQWYEGNGLVDAEVGGVDDDFGTSLLGSKLAFGIGNPDATIQSTSDINTGAWVHVAVTWTQATGDMQLYINGVLEATGSGSTNPRSAPPRITIGEIQTDIQAFDGTIDEVRIWNTIKTQAEIKSNMFNKNLANNATGLVAYYRMNDGSGTTATNSCTNTSSIDGTLNNGPTWVNSPVQFGANALHFDQVDDRVEAPLATNATSNTTIELWINHEGGTGTDHLLVSNGVMGTNGYALYINTLHQLCVQFNGVNTWNTGVTISANQWTHLALVIGSGSFIVYKDGVNVYSNTGTPITPTGSFVLGYNVAASGQPFDGMMDEVRVWNTARTQTEIQNNRNGEIDPTTAGLALYYTFNQGIAAGDNTDLSTVIDQTSNGINGTLTNFALTGSTSNYLAQNGGLVILPLKWLSFTAQNQNESVLLQWSTASENNTYNFGIEHSTDGKNWKEIGSILASNNKSTNQYNYQDYAPSNGINYYRIKQTDIDGKYSYSKIISIDLNAGTSTFRVLANPVVNNTLQINSSIKQTISLISSDGKLIWKKAFSAGPLPVHISNLAKGIYYLTNETSTQKLLIQ